MIHLMSILKMLFFLNFENDFFWRCLLELLIEEQLIDDFKNSESAIETFFK